MRLLICVLGLAAVGIAADTPFSESLYPVLEEAGCRGCHSSDGVASATRLQFPQPHRNAFIRVARSGTWKRRYRAIVKRYENTSGSPALSS